MKKILLFVSALLVSYAHSQTTLFQDNFESATPQWTLNTGIGSNSWLINNVYLGFPNFIPDTPNQPISFINGPQSTYMHITNQTVCGSLNVCNANFDTGSATNQNAEITTSINASAFTNITVSFWYISGGLTNTSFGTMQYSSDGGTTWVNTTAQYVNTSVWTQESVSLPVWNNVAALKIRFKWQNGGGGVEPAFSVDQVLITGIGSANSITTSPIAPTGWCFGAAQNPVISFTAIGTYNSGNVYTAQLSNASGSFTSPTVIGTLTSMASGALSLTSTIPTNTPVGTGYRIRIISSNPATIGTDNGANLTVHPIPTVTLSPLASACANNVLAYPLTGGSPSGGIYTGLGVSGGNFNPSVAGVGNTNITYTFSDANGCSNAASQILIVNPAPSVTFGTIATVCVTVAPFTLSQGTPAGGTYAGPGVTGGVFSPSVAGVGTWTLTYNFTDGSGCSGQSTRLVTVDGCSSLLENSLIGLTIYPNPAENVVTISANVEISSIVLLDMNGRIVKSIEKQGTINLEDLQAGIYFIQMKYNEQQFVERLIVK